jgi:hypothetical protein
MLDDFGEEVRQAQPLCLGVLGSLGTIQKKDFHEKILHPLLEALGRVPDSITTSSDGASSAFLGAWAERQDIRVQSVQADWRKLGRRAAVMRDARILKEGTHLLIFQGVRSNAYEKIAHREAMKGKHVFLVDSKTLEIQHLVLEMT